MELSRSTGAEPTLELIARRIKESQIDKFAKFLGQFPYRKSECQQNTKHPLSTDAERLTVESTRDYLERLEICQSAPFERDSTSEFVVVGVVPVLPKSEHLE